MELSELGEFGLIERIAVGGIVRSEEGLVGIGDDCAVIPQEGADDLLVTTDLLVEDIHFLRKETTPRQLGRKSIAVNVSDIAACGGRPREAIVSVALPSDIDVAFCDELFAGMKEQAHRWEVNIIGGDTTRSLHSLMISVAVIGRVPSGKAILRSGAREGDLVCVTGNLGDAAAGLDLVLNHPDLKEEYPALVEALHNPTPHVPEGHVIGDFGHVTAMIDVSDGLAADLGHICTASKVGARLYADKLPKSTELREYANAVGKDVQELAAVGGDDYVLLFSCSPDHVGPLANALAEQCRRPIHQIGVLTAGLGIELILPNGSKRELSRSGWDHFSKKSP